MPPSCGPYEGYDRDVQFGGWIDADGDCRSTRQEVLIAESQTALTFSSGNRTVSTSQWLSFYDDQTYTSAADVEIDHLVPVDEAWGSGARAWTQERRSPSSTGGPGLQRLQHLGGGAGVLPALPSLQRWRS